MNSMTQINQRGMFEDQFGRQKRKLRISVTDRCNFRCVYCMPEHPEWMNKKELLSFEELYAFCHFMVQHGVEQIRITGGEPLMRHGVVNFIQQLQQLKSLGLKRISMTTNGHYLVQFAEQLKQAGLDDLNISLDSLDPTQFKQLTKQVLEPVLDGIQAAKLAGLRIKINTVLMKGMNENQIIPLVKWAHSHHFEPRFIEFMPLDGDQKWAKLCVVSEQEILNCLSSEFDVTTQQRKGADPARRFVVNGQYVGIISTISNSFCDTCDRLRMNAQGEFFNCLFAQKGLRLKAEIQQLLNQDPVAQLQSQLDLQNKLGVYIWNKAKGYQALQTELEKMNPIHVSHARKISMHMIGG